MAFNSSANKKEKERPLLFYKINQVLPRIKSKLKNRVTRMI